jgi:hypothetical protein
VVYLIGSDAFRAVKIGWSANLAMRFGSLNTGSPFPLYLMWTAPGGRALEQQLHRDLHRFRVRGEWFDFLSRDPVTVVSRTAAAITGNQLGSAQCREAKMHAEPPLRKGGRARLPWAARKRRKSTADHVLDLLRGRGPMTMAMLLKHLDVGPSTLGSALKRLEQVGMVEHLAHGIWADRHELPASEDA